MHTRLVNFVGHFSNISVDVFLVVWEIDWCPITSCSGWATVVDRHPTSPERISNLIQITPIDKSLSHQVRRHQRLWWWRSTRNHRWRSLSSPSDNHRHHCRHRHRCHWSHRYPLRNSTRDLRIPFCLIIVLFMMSPFRGWHVFNKRSRAKLECYLFTENEWDRNSDREREKEYGLLVMSDFVRFVGHVSRKH